jgi:hypothetical protein
MGELTPRDIGIVAGVVIILIAGSRGIWVWGYLYKRELERADRLETMLYQLLGVTKKLVDKEK